MGFFSSFKPFKAISRIVQPVLNNPIKAVARAAQAVIKDPVRASLGVASGGLSELARQAPIVGSAYRDAVTFASTGYKAAANIYTSGLYGSATGLGSTILQPLEKRGDNMAIDIGGLINTVGGIFSRSGNPYLSGVGNVAQGFTSFLPRAAPSFAQPQIQAQPVMSALPAIRSGGALVARGFSIGFRASRLGCNSYAHVARKLNDLNCTVCSKGLGQRF